MIDMIASIHGDAISARTLGCGGTANVKHVTHHQFYLLDIKTLALDDERRKVLPQRT